MKNDKPKLAIVDLADCEGCQVEFFSLEDKLPSLWQKFDIVSWRMAQNYSNLDYLDICLIEGTPIKKESREKVKKLREKSSLLGGLGSCADLGGINAIKKGKKRDKAFKRVYSKNKPSKREVKPLSEYIKVDFKIPGCPIRPHSIAQTLSQLLIGKVPQPKPYPVCFECKLKGNKCLLNQGIPCLGPITAGGCEAICLQNGYPCLGCFGKLKGAQGKKLKKLIEKQTSKQRAKKMFEVFLNNFS